MKAQQTVVRIFLTAVLCCLLLPNPARANTVLRVGGNGTGLELVKALIPEFEKAHRGVKVQVMKSLGSSGGVKALNAGALDLAVTSRPLKEEEKGHGAREVFHGRTPFIFMANEGVSKTDISTAEVEAFYGGRVSNWPDGSPLRLVLRPEGDTDTKTIQAISPESRRALGEALRRPGMLIALTDEDSDRYITRTPGALGGSSLAQVTTGRLPCRVLSFNGVKPSLEAMEGGSYPLVKQVIMVLRQPMPAARHAPWSTSLPRREA